MLKQILYVQIMCSKHVVYCIL